MWDARGDESDCYNVTRQVIPGELEPSPRTSSLIVHYKIQVDVVDARYNLVASRSKPKQIQLSFVGLTPGTDAEEIADSLVGQSDLLPQSRRPALIKALASLIAEIGRCSPTPDAPPARAAKPAPDTPSTRELAVTLSTAEVDRLLHDALQKIHWGDESSCLKTLQQLVDISQFDRNLSIFIQHEPLMNTLINKLKTFASSSLPACICIIGIFEKMSYFSNYQESIGRFKIGAMSLSLLHAQVKLASVAVRKLQPQAKAAYLHTQNQLLSLVVSLLFNLSESASAMRKMVNKDVVAPLTLVLKRSHPDLVSISLKFLRRIALVPVTWPDITVDTITEIITTRILKWKTDDPETRMRVLQVLREAIELLFSFSFHPESIEEFKKNNIFVELAALAGTVELRAPLIKFFYKCATAENLDAYFRDTALLDMLISATTSRCDERLLSLVILMKLSNDPGCAATIAKSAIFTPDTLHTMFVQATDRQAPENKSLLRMIRNVADHQPSFVEGFDNEIVQAALKNAQNMEVLSDVFAISSRTKMSSARAKFFTSDKGFVVLLSKILSNKKALPQLQLECVMFVSSVILYSEPAKILGGPIVDGVVNVFTWSPDDLDIQTQCLFAFYRFICHTDSRSALVGRPGIVEAVIRHSSSRNPVLSGMANSVLEVLVTIEKEWSERIKRPRYMAFNDEWIRALK
jgi:hypothetical protein